MALITARILSPSFSLFSPHRRKISIRAVLQSRAKTNLTTPSESSLNKFSNWVVETGAIKPSVKPGLVPEGLGLIANRDFSQNEVVLEIPKKLWIDSDTIASSEIGRVCGGVRPWVGIALFILREKMLGDESKWKPYLDILPESTNSTLFWSEEELSEIQGTQLLSTTMSVKDYVQSEFSKVQEEIINPNRNLFPGKLNSEDFLWAFGILRSRAFSELRGDNLALIPFADLVNHSNEINSEELSYEIKGKGFFGRDQVFALRTPLSVKSGQQVYIQYDLKKSNAELALDYGLTDISNPTRNSYTLTLEISQSDPFYGDKLDIAESNGLDESMYFDIVLGQNLPPQILPYLRLVAIGGSDAFLLEAIFRNKVWGFLESPVSRENEERICQVVVSACQDALSRYNTTIEEDEELMKGELDERFRVAVGVRMGEKKVLRQIEEIFRDREDELDELEYYQERRLKDLGLIGEKGEIIFWE
ncbi:hypothetical protein LUZ60_003118 [Juncus effusus]|nr:hypothetical protein LUZ60_003118 [Juncus effusus]